MVGFTVAAATGAVVSFASAYALVDAARRGSRARSDPRGRGPAAPPRPAPGLSPTAPVGPAAVARRSCPWLAAAAAAVGLTLLAVALVGVVVPGPPAETIGWICATGAVLVATALGGAVLRVDGPTTRALRLRLGLDCLVVGASALYVLWIAVVGETNPATLRVGVVVPTAAAALVLGLTLAALVARPGYGHGSRLVGAAAIVVATGLAVMTVSVFVDGWWTVPGAALATLGCVLLVPAIRVTRPEPNLSARPPLGLKLPLIAVGADCAAALYEVFRGGALGTGGVVLACTVAFGLAFRQALYQKDERRVTLELAERERRYRILAHTDPLTKLANRRELTRVLAEEPAAGRPCALIAIDLDNFKDLNELGGHELGDLLLKEVGRRLRDNLRDRDLAARVGGDEFAVLLWAAPDQARVVADRLMAALAEPFEPPGYGSVTLSASMGLAASPEGTADKLLRNADLALRFAKHEGKGRLETYDPEYETFLRRNLAIERELKGAGARGELTLVYQPVMALPGEKLVGVEALLRWEHPDLGKVSPGEFIPIAEDSGLIIQLGAWVLHEACRQLARWLADGYDVWVSVNVSVRELRESDYVERLVEILRTHQVPPHRLVLEVTEHALALDLQQLVGRLYDLRNVGVRFALDDFGAGYSSLGQLRSLPVDILKIDRALVVDTVREPMAPKPVGPLVDVVVVIAQRLGLQVIAEGVEKQPHRAAVEEAGCGLVQGYLFAGPMSVEKVGAMLDPAPEAGAAAFRA